MNKMQNSIKNNTLINTLEENIEIRVRMLQVAFAGFVFFALLYLFFLGSAVFNVVERKSLEAEAHTLSNQIGELELKYLQVSGQIDRDLSKSMGFEEIAQNFATRESITLIGEKIARNEI